MGRIISKLVAPVMALAFGLFSAAAAPAQPVEAATDEEVPVLLQADEMSHDRELGIITARGNVEISRLDYVLIADTVTYNQRDDVMTAQGNVTILEPTGNVVFSHYMELTGDLKDGIVEDIRVILSDGARFAANGARRTGGVIHEMSKAVYSPCEVCREDPSRAPLWQIKAIKIVHDQRRHEVSYRDAWLEVKGIPVAYTPYFSHPDPTVKRRSGFLFPSFGSLSDLGYVIRTPYFININPWQDATLTPIYTSDEGPVLAAEYRHRFRRGELNLAGSVTNDSDNETRGHIDAEGRLDLNRTWRTGFDIERSTDDTYLRRYSFPSDSDKTLTSRVYAEGFRKRNYMAANAYAFQGLEEDDDPGETPLVLPMMEYHHVGEPDRLGGRTRLDTSVVALNRNEGTDTRRFSVTAGWDLPYVAPKGDIYTLSASVRGDVYHVSDLDRSDKPQYDGFSERMLYEVGLHWRYPLAKTHTNALQVLEPMASVIVSPYGGNPDTIPNDDSPEFEFDDTNLFSSNRFPGLDLVEGGPRVNYGLRWGIYGLGGGHTSFLIGQSVRMHADDTFTEGSGLEDHVSDIVARAEISPGDYFDLTYKTRIDKEDFEVKRNEVSLSAGPDAFRLGSSYVFFDQQPNSEFSTSREEIRSNAAVKLNRFWRTEGAFVYDLEADEARSLGLNLIYEDECLVFNTRFGRTFYEDRDIEPADTIYFTIGFKTLGEVVAQAL